MIPFISAVLIPPSIAYLVFNYSKCQIKYNFKRKMNYKAALSLPLLLLAAFSHAASSFKPLDSVTSKFFFADEKVSFLEGQSGLKLKQGSNLFLFEDGFYKPNDKTVFYYQLKQTWNNGELSSDIFRAYFKYSFAKLSIEAGR